MYNIQGTFRTKILHDIYIYSIYSPLEEGWLASWSSRYWTWSFNILPLWIPVFPLPLRACLFEYKLLLLQFSLPPTQLFSYGAVTHHSTYLQSYTGLCCVCIIWLLGCFQGVKSMLTHPLTDLEFVDSAIGFFLLCVRHFMRMCR